LMRPLAGQDPYVVMIHYLHCQGTYYKSEPP